MKRLLLFLPILSLLVVIALLSSCLDEGVKANESIPGLWKVTSIKSFYGQFSDNGGHSGLDIKSEEGDLGYFYFTTGADVNYKFLRNDTTYENSANWNLQSRDERVSGFKVTKYTLEISNDFEFEVEFGDGSKNSQVRARQLELTQWPTEAGYGVGIIMQLSKH